MAGEADSHSVGGGWACAAMEARVGGPDDKSVGLATMETLLEAVELTKATTMQELREELGKCVEWMKTSDLSTASITSASELFIRFISLSIGTLVGDFEQCRVELVSRGRLYLERAGNSRHLIASLAAPLLARTRHRRLLTHSHSRVVLSALRQAAKAGPTFEVYVTQSLPDNAGLRMKTALEEAGIPATLILDGAAAYTMESVDAVVLGAEGIVETGGVINKIGSYGIALAAKAHHKPLFVLAESFKFLRDFPLSQAHIPETFKYTSSTLSAQKCVKKEHPLVDYTPASLVSLLVTDHGILTPAAVSDKLINLYL